MVSGNLIVAISLRMDVQQMHAHERIACQTIHRPAKHVLYL
jgi:hypothetical protein